MCAWQRAVGICIGVFAEYLSARSICPGRAKGFELNYWMLRSRVVRKNEYEEAL